MADIDQLVQDIALFRQEFGHFSGAVSTKMEGFERQLGEVHGEVKDIARTVSQLQMERAEQRGAIKAKAGMLTNWREWLTPVIALAALLIAIYDRLKASLDAFIR